MNILVFATSINRKKDAQNIANILINYYTPKSVNFDLEDRENILRIEGENLVSSKIKNTLFTLGYECEELI